ncbi:hypothetical protein DSO57_1004978 [Entomophthora muscae]|uniref:Uncharacterized protein n=1 Tax=Entomophthora muscae TaxID=34485 RepID=A0ACC2SXD3_9FUNG|nr:hypothetical protein DSO57_1004978 [Entomophthora muscae]
MFYQLRTNKPKLITAYPIPPDLRWKGFPAPPTFAIRNLPNSAPTMQIQHHTSTSQTYRMQLNQPLQHSWIGKPTVTNHRPEVRTNRAQNLSPHPGVPSTPTN